jgi:NADPH2:quinone reductase
MKAIRVHGPGGPEVLRLEDVPTPTAGPGEALVRLEATGVNFIDIYQREGLYPMPMPFTPGREGAGTVVAVGSEVTEVAVGDRVVSESFSGSYAEFAVVRADRLVRLTDRVDTQTAAAAMLQGLTAHYLVTSTYPLKPGDTCLVHAAAGGVGLQLCQMAACRGATVLATTSTDAKAAEARKAGASEVVLYTRESLVDRVRALTGGRGVQVVYDSVGKTTFEGSLDCLALRGMLVLFGQSSGAVPPFDPQILNRKGSLFLTRPTLAHYVDTRQELDWRTSELFTWIQSGTIRVKVDRVLRLAEARDAHRALESRATIGKIVLA